MSYSKYYILSVARQDLDEYALYLFEHAPDVADRFRAAFRQTAKGISQFPMSSPLYSSSAGFHPTSPLRFRAVREFSNVLIFYRLNHQRQVEIVRILHSARNIPGALDTAA